MTAALALVLALLLPAARAEDPPAAPEVPEAPAAERAAALELLGRLGERMEDVRHLRAEYVQERTSELLVRPLVSKGTFWYRADPGCLVFEVREPRPARIRTDATSHLTYHPERKRATKLLFESDERTRALLSAFAPDVEALERHFRITGLARVDGLATVELVPREARLLRFLAVLRVTLREEDATLVRLEHAGRDGERVTLRLSEVTLDPELPPERLAAAFDPTLPADVEVAVRRVGDGD